MEERFVCVGPLCSYFKVFAKTSRKALTSPTSCVIIEKRSAENTKN